MNDKRKNILMSLILETICHCRAKNINVAKKAIAKIIKNTFLFPTSTANVLFFLFWSFSMSGASRLKLRIKPYIMKVIEKKKYRVKPASNRQIANTWNYETGCNSYSYFS